MTDWLEFHPEKVKLHSGDESHWLINAQKMFDDIHIRTLVLESWGKYARLFKKKTVHVVGVPEGGMPWAQALAQHIGASWSRLDQSLPTNHKDLSIFLVDDVATTGGSILIPGPFVFRFLVAARDPVLQHKFRDTYVRVWMWIDLTEGVLPSGVKP